jgi:hypothetical protein
MERSVERLYSSDVAQRATTGGTPASYRRVCELASGGMGTVELAVREEGRFRRLYAIKRLREIYREDDEAREMFLDEARIAGLLRHPNAVSVLDVDEDDDGPFLVMDYVEGASVGKIIARATTEPRSGARSAKPSDGEWGPGDSHALGETAPPPRKESACRSRSRSASRSTPPKVCTRRTSSATRAAARWASCTATSRRRTCSSASTASRA